MLAEKIKAILSTIEFVDLLTYFIVSEALVTCIKNDRKVITC